MHCTSLSAKRNQLEESIGELEQKETRMVLDGGDLDEIHGQLVVEGDSLMKAMKSVCEKRSLR